MRRCEDEKVRYRPPLLEEPCAQTLSGKKVQRADLRRILQLKLAVWSIVGHLVKARKELEPSAELDMVCANQSMTVSATDKETSDE